MFKCFMIAAVCAAALPGHSPALAQLSQGIGDLRVMTYNVDEGTDFLEVQQATSASQFLVAVGQTISQVRATNPPARMKALATQIIAAGPTLVSLQELDQWSTGTFDGQTCGPVKLEFNLLQELMSALQDQGASYVVAVQGPQYAFPPTPGLLASGAFICVQVTNYNAILARSDLDPRIFRWGNPQSGQYPDFSVINTPFGPVPLPAAWVAVDASFHGNVFRFIGTHFESVDANIRRRQAADLRSGPAATASPIVIAMDSNAQAAPAPQDPTYTDFIAAGYLDVWSEVFPGVAGFTCCQAQLVNNPLSQLNQRIDLLLTLGGVVAQNIALFGANLADKTPDGLWPSDHAGVAAQILVQNTAPQ